MCNFIHWNNFIRLYVHRQSHSYIATHTYRQTRTQTDTTITDHRTQRDKHITQTNTYTQLWTVIIISNAKITNNETNRLLRTITTYILLFKIYIVYTNICTHSSSMFPPKIYFYTIVICRDRHRFVQEQISTHKMMYISSYYIKSIRTFFIKIYKQLKKISICLMLKKVKN